MGFYLINNQGFKLLLFILFISLGSTVIITSCSENQRPGNTPDEKVELIDQLQGKWQMKSRKFAPDTSFVAVPDTIVYEKLIQGNSFVWYTYQKNNREVIAMAGGEFELEGQSYSENIEFYYPKGTGIEGSEIPFRCELENGKWHHAGYIYEREYDSAINDYVVTAERRLEEIWVKANKNN
jgi:hypothetical protein